MSQRRLYLDAVKTTMTRAGLGPIAYGHQDGHTPAWFQWAPGQYALNADAWPSGLYVTWDHTLGWHYSTDRDAGVRPLPFTVGADPMDVTDGVRRLLLGLVRDLPASTDEWPHAPSLTAGEDGSR